MQEIAWFIAGAAAFALAHGVRTWLNSSPPRRGSRSGRQVVRPAPVPIVANGATKAAAPCENGDARALVKSVGDELATLASGVEGRAHLLIEAAPDRRALPAAAEGMLRAVQRLRTLHRKIVAFAIDRGAAPGRAELAQVVDRLADDLQQLQLGLELHWHPPAMLPPVAVAPGVVGDILLFLSAAMIRAEPGATRLTLVGEMSLGEVPRVKLELSLEWAEESNNHESAYRGEEGRRIDFEAAANLVRAQGGTIEFTHAPGRFARALVRLPAAARETLPAPVVLEPRPRPAPPAAPPVTVPPSPPPGHHFGGALLLESDPTIRAMVARELKASGRAVFACADSASARAFLETTPERFELLVVDHPRRLAPNEALAAAVRTVAPNLKVFVLDGELPAGDSFPALHGIPKPFGVHELREALALVLAAR
ncbi:MAG: hypothetical protein H6838_01155 [Planctomycetes bacterium]|nr:hypothetical protein [Planctomycetota bacterium]MCB9884064.1 hypothetical protein [Planctomycetota bacterium]